MSTQQTNKKLNLIKELRRTPAKALRAHERRGIVTKSIIDDLKNCGTFFKTTEGHFYFRREGTPRIFAIGANVALCSLIEEQYGINPAEKLEFGHVLSRMEIEAETKGEPVEMHRLAHYEVSTGKLYISRFDGTLYRLHGKTIEVVPNGSDGIFFLDDPGWEPYKIASPVSGLSFAETIIKSANFCDSGRLTRTEQQWVFHTWCLAQFFGSIHPTKPLLLVCGEKGGGKTLCLRKWLRFLFGSSADVTGLERGKPDGFIAAVCSSALAVFDNVDEHVSWLPDHLAQIATGIKFKRRKYYTTNELVEFKPQCFVALTSRTPKFIDGRDDVLDRTVVLHTARRKSFAPESDQLRIIAENRNALWSELLHQLSRVVAQLNSEKAVTENVAFRMADFASFAMTVAKAEGNQEMALRILAKLDSGRSDMLLAEEPIAQCLEVWLEQGQNHGRTVDSADLNPELREIALVRRIIWPYGSAHALGQRLSHITTNLKQRFEVEVERDSSNQLQYRFSPKLRR